MEEQFQELEVHQSVAKAASTLNLNENTFTGYYLKFEKLGYTFKRSSDNKVVFSEIEIEMFQDFLVEKGKPKTTIEQAIKNVLKKYLTTLESEISVPVKELVTLKTAFEKKLEELQLFALQQSKELQEFKEQRLLESAESQRQFKELKDKFQESQEQLKLFQEQEIKARDELLMKSIRETQEVKQMLLEDREERKLKEQAEKEVATAQEKKGFFARLFGK